MDLSSNPSLFRALSDFLEHPVIQLEDSHKIQDLRRELDSLRIEYQKLQVEYDRLKVMYQGELTRVLDLQDMCREHGLKWR